MGARLRLVPRMDLLEVKSGQCLDPPSHRTTRAYFPLTALAALYQEGEDGACTQVAQVGHEGVIGVSLVTAVHTPGLRSIVHTAGTVLAVDGDTLRTEFARGGSTMCALLRYTQALMAEMAQMALCNRHHSVDQQLARWLLMTTDRLDTPEIDSTQEAVAMSLGVRREAVSEAVSRLRDAAIVATGRGRIRVMDRERLQSRACGCYRMLRAGHAQVLAPLAHAARLQEDDTLAPSPRLVVPV
jgi:CRP-like cAMP-binding protein